MADPAVAVQKAVFAALSSHPDLIAAFEGRPRVYDRVPKVEDAKGVVRPPAFPYLTIGDDDLVDDSNSCFDAFEVFVRVHVWSRDVGRVEAKRFAGLARDALNVALDIDGYVATEFRHRNTRVLDDPDGLTTHAVVEFRYLVDEA